VEDARTSAFDGNTLRFAARPYKVQEHRPLEELMSPARSFKMSLH